MENIQETRNLRSNAVVTNLASWASDPEQILRGTDGPLFYTIFENPRYAVLEPVETMEAAMKSDNIEPPSSPNKRLKHTRDVPRIMPELLIHANLRASKGEIAQKEASRIYALTMNQLLIKKAEDALSYAFQIGYKEAHEGFKNALFYFVETILTEMVQHGTLVNTIERNIEK